MITIYCCEIFVPGTDICWSWVHEFEEQQDLRAWDDVDRCSHCELPLVNSDNEFDPLGQCRAEECMSHIFEDDGERKAWVFA
jgi:hypothetical protein